MTQLYRSLNNPSHYFVVPLCIPTGTVHSAPETLIMLSVVVNAHTFESEVPSRRLS